MKRKSINFTGMTISEAASFLLQQLRQIYDSREAVNISDLVMENITGLPKMDRVMQKDLALQDKSLVTLNQYITALRNHDPVQYVLGEAWFYGLKFFVDRNVLVPRPETEELVQWTIEDHKNKSDLILLDIGTGSGCISIALKKKLPSANISSYDISEGALSVAKRNATALNVDVDFHLLNILDRNAWINIPMTNVIISNPPYIPEKEKLFMDDNVVAHEPHLALFVDDDDPLVFYKAIAELGTGKLFPSGEIYVETHADLANETAMMFRSAGYHPVEIKKDMQGKERMIKACLTQ